MNSDTPEKIRLMPVDQVLHYVETNSSGNVSSPRVRLNYIKMLYDVLGYELTADVALAAVNEPPAALVLSTAGGGKTTWSQIKAIEQKFIRRSKKNPKRKIRGSEILCLVYNNHNVDDMKLKHTQMVQRLTSAGIPGLTSDTIDSSINACTMHSFCDFFRRQFVAKLNMIGFTLADDTTTRDMMQRAINLEFKIAQLDGAKDVPVDKMLSLFDLRKETLREHVIELEETDVFSDIGLTSDFIETIFTRYENIKNKSRKYTFIDMLYSIYQLLQRDETCLETVQSYYEYVIADEVQDFTPLMWEILKLFVSDGTPLTCIGDEDQNLYLFRGADINDTLHFKDRFPGGKVFTLSENRRCRKTILNEAIRVISENEYRFNKEIIGNKPGGSIEFIPYSSTETQVIKLVNDLKKLSEDDWNKTVVCYRNIECSQLIAEVLAEEGISINCLRSSMPYGHELYSHLIGLFTALEMPCDRSTYKCLWKVLPCKKSEFFEAIGFDTTMNRFRTPDDKIHFAEFNYGKLMNYRGFADAIEMLHKISDVLSYAPMSEIFPPIMRMLNVYFWNYKRSINNNDEMDDIFEKRVEKKFNVDKKYSQVYQEMQEIKSICVKNTKVGAGVTLSTFHSLKGLEFKHVYATFLDNDVFPNFPLIEYKSYAPEITKGLKEAETRLWYVAVTRAIDTLTVYYNENNPSKYVLDYFDSKNKPLTTSPAQVYSVDDLQDGVGLYDFRDVEEEDFVTPENGVVEEFVSHKIDTFIETPENQPGPEIVAASTSQGASDYLSTLFKKLC